MYMQKVGFFLLSMFLFLGCVQNSEKKVEKERPNALEDGELPSYDKYQEGLENQRMN